MDVPATPAVLAGPAGPAVVPPVFIHPQFLVFACGGPYEALEKTVPYLKHLVGKTFKPQKFDAMHFCSVTKGNKSKPSIIAAMTFQLAPLGQKRERLPCARLVTHAADPHGSDASCAKLLKVVVSLLAQKMDHLIVPIKTTSGLKPGHVRDAAKEAIMTVYERAGPYWLEYFLYDYDWNDEAEESASQPGSAGTKDTLPPPNEVGVASSSRKRSRQ